MWLELQIPQKLLAASGQHRNKSANAIRDTTTKSSSAQRMSHGDTMAHAWLLVGRTEDCDDHTTERVSTALSGH